MPKRPSFDSVISPEDKLDELADALRKRAQEEPFHPCAPRWRKDLKDFDAAVAEGRRVKSIH